MKLGKIGALLSKPGKKIDEIKLQAFSVGYNKIVADYKSFRLHTVQAMTEMRLGIVTDGTIAFFGKRILHYFFKKDEQGAGLAAKVRVGNIVANWVDGVIVKEDADWLKEVFLPMLDECEQKDLSELARIMKVDKLLEKVVGE